MGLGVERQSTSHGELLVMRQDRIPHFPEPERWPRWANITIGSVLWALTVLLRHFGFILLLLVAAPVLAQHQLSVTPFVTVNSVDNVKMADRFPGADAGAKIANAAAALPSGGGIVDARGFQGAQTISTAITLPASSVQLLLGAATFTYTGGTTSYIIAMTGGGSCIVGIGQNASIITTATAANGIQPVTNSCIYNLTLRGPNSSMSPSQGINSGSTDNVRVENVTVEQWGNHGINTGGSSTRWTITHNVVQNNTNDGILLSGLSDHAIVTNNQVKSNGSNGIDTNSSYGVIADNNVDSNGSGHSSTDCWGILVGAVSGFSANSNLVSGNTVSNSTCQNIILKPFTSQTVNDNTVIGNTTFGGTAVNNDAITLDGSSAGTLHANIIIGNTAKTLVRHGIFVDGSVGTVTGNSVLGNIIEGAGGTGILIGTGATDTLVATNTATGNTTAQITDSGTTTDLYGNRTTTGVPGVSCTIVGATAHLTVTNGIVTLCN